MAVLFGAAETSTLGYEDGNCGGSDGDPVGVSLGLIVLVAASLGRVVGSWLGNCQLGTADGSVVGTVVGVTDGDSVAVASGEGEFSGLAVLLGSEEGEVSGLLAIVPDGAGDSLVTTTGEPSGELLGPGV